MSGDFDERAAPLWSVYVRKAEAWDKGYLVGLKEEMATVMTFAGLFSAAVTTFLVSSYPTLQPDPPSQTEVIAQQSVFILTSIAVQLGVNASTLPDPSLPRLDTFAPTASNVRVNTLWSLSLVFSLLAALSGNIIQQWARDYTRIYQRQASDLRRARIRHYFFEGAEAFKLAVMLDLIPILLHSAVFLFFIGLCDMLWQINRVVSLTIVSPVALAGTIYICLTVSHVIDAQSPYRSPFSGPLWYLVQRVRESTRRNLNPKGPGRSISCNMLDGCAQLAMDECDRRRKRDGSAVCWLVNNLTNVELEPFLHGIPGSLGTKWGRAVWREVALMTMGQNVPLMTMVGANAESDTSALISSTSAVFDLRERVTLLLRTCIDPGVLEPAARRRRCRTCIEAILSLTLYMKEGESQWNPDRSTMVQALHYLADASSHPAVKGQDVRPLADHTFRPYWICMSILIVHASIQDVRVRESAGRAINEFAFASAEPMTNIHAAAMKCTALFDKLVKKAWDAGRVLHDTLDTTNASEEGLMEVREEHGENIAELEYCWNIMGWAKPADDAMRSAVEILSEVTEGLLMLLPSASIATAPSVRPHDTYGVSGALIPHFLLPLTMVRRLAGTAWSLQDMRSAAWEWYLPKPKLVDLSPAELFGDDMCRRMSSVAAGREGSNHPFREQLWRLEDLAAEHGGSLYALDLLFLELRSSPVRQTLENKELYLGTFRVVIAHWKARCDAHDFQAGLVARLRDILWTDTVGTARPLRRLPSFIIDEMLRLVTDVFSSAKKPSTTIIDDAVRAVEECLLLPSIPTSTRSLGQVFLENIRPPRLDMSNETTTGPTHIRIP
ncbi:unnamed protein product [Peniophora sp. CBMAI 1063]|nr:unnamed protein product [Peniophora sp. CBMAI 1063]